MVYFRTLPSPENAAAAAWENLPSPARRLPDDPPGGPFQLVPLLAAMPHQRRSSDGCPAAHYSPPGLSPDAAPADLPAAGETASPQIDEAALHDLAATLGCALHLPTSWSAPADSTAARVDYLGDDAYLYQGLLGEAQHARHFNALNSVDALFLAAFLREEARCPGFDIDTFFPGMPFHPTGRMVYDAQLAAARATFRQADMQYRIRQLVAGWDLRKHGAIGTYVPACLSALFDPADLDPDYLAGEIQAAIALIRARLPGDYPYSWKDVFRLLLSLCPPPTAFRVFAGYETIYKAQGGTQWEDRLQKAGAMAATIGESRSRRVIAPAPPVVAALADMPDMATRIGIGFSCINQAVHSGNLGPGPVPLPGETQLQFQMQYEEIVDGVVATWERKDGPSILYCQHVLKKRYPDTWVYQAKITRQIRLAAESRQADFPGSYPRDWLGVYSMLAEENHQDPAATNLAMDAYKGKYHEYGGPTDWLTMRRNLKYRHFKKRRARAGLPEALPPSTPGPPRRHRPGGGRRRTRPVALTTSKRAQRVACALAEQAERESRRSSSADEASDLSASPPEYSAVSED